MTVFKLRLEGYSGEMVLTDIKDCLDEIQILSLEDADQTIIITKTEMSEEEFEKLPEFGGY